MEEQEGSWGLTNFAAQPLPKDRGHRGIAHFMSYYGFLIIKVLFIRIYDATSDFLKLQMPMFFEAR